MRIIKWLFSASKFGVACYVVIDNWKAELWEIFILLTLLFWKLFLL